jgi:hypothetical protein
LSLLLRHQRPHGFKDYIAEQGFHSVYLITTGKGWPVKVGIAADPVRRLNGLQNANFETLRFHRFWWVAGRPVAARIEQAFKARFATSAIRGEWFDVAATNAEAFIADTIHSLGTWGIDQEQAGRLMEEWQRHCMEKSLERINRSHQFSCIRQVKWPVSRLTR